MKSICSTYTVEVTNKELRLLMESVAEAIGTRPNFPALQDLLADLKTVKYEDRA